MGRIISQKKPNTGTNPNGLARQPVPVFGYLLLAGTGPTSE